MSSSSRCQTKDKSSNWRPSTINHCNKPWHNPEGQLRREGGQRPGEHKPPPSIKSLRLSPRPTCNGCSLPLQPEPSTAAAELPVASYTPEKPEMDSPLLPPVARKARAGQVRRDGGPRRGARAATGRDRRRRRSRATWGEGSRTTSRSTAGCGHACVASCARPSQTTGGRRWWWKGRPRASQDLPKASQEQPKMP